VVLRKGFTEGGGTEGGTEGLIGRDLRKDLGRE